MAGYAKWPKRVNSSPRPHLESRHFCNNPQHKVSHKDNHPCRQASHHLELMLYPQHRKGNHTEATSKAGRQNVQHLHQGRLPVT